MGKGGGGGHTPVEAPESGRSKQQVKIVEIISEGEVKGLVDGVKSVFLDNTPIQAQDGSYNFNNIFAEGRIGSQDQDVMSGFNTSEKEVNVGVQVKYGVPIVRTVTDEKISRLRFTLGVQSLSSVNDQGDTNPTSVQFRVTIGNKTPTIHIIDGKYSSQYLRAFIFDNLPAVPFTIKVERLTEDSKTTRLQNNTIWASYTEIIDTQFAYPNTALVGIKFDSEQFSGIPTRTYEVYGIKVQVPSNYDPIKRTYTGIWDGTFKVDWTNNPLWILYDNLVNTRYGAGRRISPENIDVWSFYAAAQYCDQMIPDGFGGTEPRFTCNLWETRQRQLYDVINDYCSVFRAMPVWNGQMLTLVMDRPADPVYTYTNANVAEGDFTYTYSALKSRHNAIQVEYIDPSNNYETALEYVSADDAIRKNGLNLLKITAFGCTSRGQAFRQGKWTLETERLETKTVTFSVGTEGLMNIPGDIIRVADNNYAGTELGGRVTAIDGKTVTLDRDIELISNCYFTYISKEAKHKDVKIIGVVNGSQITLESEPIGLAVNDVWSLTSKQVSVQLFKCLSITEDEKGKYTITALQHEPQKEAIVDNSAVFEPVNTSLYRGPASVTHASVSATENGIELNWELPITDGAVTYEVKLYKDGKFYRLYTNLKSSRLTFEGLPDGLYTAEIRSKNQYGQYSAAVIKTFEINLTVKNLKTLSQLFAIEVQWELPSLSTVGNSTEIWHSRADSLSSATKLVTLPYPITSYVMGNVGLTEKHYFWARLVDKNGNKGEFTEGVFGECDHNPDKLVSYLEGQITLTELGQELIDSLKEDINSAVGEETKLRQSAIANAIAQIIAESQARAKAIQEEAKARAEALTAEASNRTKTIQAESANLTKKIQAEATARGTAVTQLQNVDAQQAQLISAVTAKADNVLSGLEEEKIARANADKAESQAREALTARMGTAESNIATIQRSVATNTQNISEVSQNLNSKINNISVGGRNLLRNSNTNYTGSRYMTNWTLAKIPDVGEQVTVTLWGELAEDRQAFGVYNTHGFRELAKLIKVRDGVYSATFTWRNPLNQREEKDNSLSTHLNIYAYPRIATSNNTIKQVKLELGNIATDWTPAPEDVESSVSAVSADLTSYKQTQANADLAQSQQITGLTTRMSDAESSITRNATAITTLNQSTATQLNTLNSKISNAESGISSLQSVVNQANDSISQTVQTLTAKIDSIQVGGRNYIRNSIDDITVTAPASRYVKIPSLLNEINEPFIVSAFVKDLEGNNGNKLTVIMSNPNNPNNNEQRQDCEIINGRIIAKFNALENPTYTQILLYANSGGYGGSATGSVTYYKVKLELGNIATDWTPAPEDVESSMANVNAKLTAHQQAQATKDQATVTQLNGLTTRIGSAESNISAIQSTKASKTEVASIAQSSLQAVWKADAQSAVDNISVGGRNLLRNSTTNYTGSRYMTNWTLAKIPDVGEQVTVTLWGELAEDRQAFGVYNTHGFRELAKLIKVRDGVYSATFTWRNPLNQREEKDNSLSTHLNIYAYPRTATSNNTIKQVKLELGNIATDWTPAPEDVESSIESGKALISQVSNAVSDINGRLSATHTLKTQVISGGRTAIAGIALGATADNKTTESSVIVMADKFGIVANANDGNVKPVFSVANGQVGIRGDLVVAGSVTRDRLSSGSGENLLYNPIFANNGYGWPLAKGSLPSDVTVNMYYKKGTNGEEWTLINGLDGETLPTVRINGRNFRTQGSVTLNRTSPWFDIANQLVTVTPGKWYMFSAWIKGYNCKPYLLVEEYSDKSTYVKYLAHSRHSFQNGGSARYGLQQMERDFIKFKAPASGLVSVRMRCMDWASGVDFCDIYLGRPMLEECTEHTTEPSPWANAGVTQVHGGSIIANTIRGEHIQANQTLSSPNINGGTITGNTISGTNITGSNISGTNINGGTVTGTTVKGGRIEGGVISGSTILGDIVKAVILTKKGNNFEGTVPASEVSSRTVVIPSFSFKANPNETSTIAIYIDGIKVSESSISGIHKIIPIQHTIPSTTVRGTVSVSVSGDVSGELSGDVRGDVRGQVGGNVNGGYVSGSVSGTASGRASGRVSGLARGLAEGSIPSTFISTSFTLDVPSFGSISGYKQITGKSVIIKVTANNATALSGQNSLIALVA